MSSGDSKTQVTEGRKCRVDGEVWHFLRQCKLPLIFQTGGSILLTHIFVVL